MPGINLIVNTILTPLHTSIKNGNALLIPFLWAKTPPERYVILLLHDSGCKIQSFIILALISVRTLHDAGSLSDPVRADGEDGLEHMSVLVMRRLARIVYRTDLASRLRDDKPDHRPPPINTMPLIELLLCPQGCGEALVQVFLGKLE